MNGDDEPITRRELRAELAAFATKQEMRLEIATAMNYVVETLGARFDQMRVDLVTMREDLSRELAGHVRAAAEENRQFLAVLDDRYRDLPPRVAVLEREIDEHRSDPTLHPRRRRK